MLATRCNANVFPVGAVMQRENGDKSAFFTHRPFSTPVYQKTVRCSVRKGINFSRPLNRLANTKKKKALHSSRLTLALPMAVDKTSPSMNPRFPQGLNNYNSL